MDNDFSSIFALTTTKLTKEIAFNDTFQSHIMPPKLMTMNSTVKRMINPAIKSNPVRIKDTMKMVINDPINDHIVSRQITRYCS